MQNTFTISPMSQTLALVPGETVSGTLIIANPAEAEADFHYQVTVVPYNVSGEEYTVDTSAVSTYSQLANWVEVTNAHGTIPPNGTERVTYTIRVPENAPGGGQAAALIVSPDTSQAEANGVAVNNVFQMASVIYANVAGETVESGEVLENYLPSFTVLGAVNSTALLTNTGNVYETATISLTVTNKLTGEKILAAESENGNTFAEIILPETTRQISRKIENLPVVGVVEVEQTINYAGQTSTTVHDLWICPLWLMAIVILVIVGIVSGIVLAVARHRRHRMVI